ncbi:SPOR domain-containing protein [Coprobacter fastidiosus]|uniref:HU domain-containing protein n=1 Tax=Coprobacter fastidiosus TaxID=1099853 RepID=UPI00266F6173|nr:SPOR domain-containing protein [Coprobacter fastidiosus]
MLELVRHIEYLLTEHDCVLVPGLGGFVLQYVPARFSEDRKSIQPPGKQITFNSSLSYNDGLLAQSLMRTLDIDYGKAVAMIERWVDEIKRSFSEPGDSYAFGELGTFVLSDERSLIFEPPASCLFGISAFGLKKLNICPLGQLHKDENVAEPKLRSKKRDVVYIPVNKSFVRQLIAVAAIIILLLMISTPMSEMKTTSDYASLVSSELFENGKDGEIEINDIVSLQQGNDSVIAAENNFSTVQKSEQDNSQVANISDSDVVRPYIVVVATLSGKQAALRQLEQFKQQGVTADLKIYETSKKVRIYIDSFSEKEEAQKFLMTLRNGDSPFSDAWVMSVRR